MPAPAYGDEVSLIGLVNTSLLQPGEVATFIWSTYLNTLVSHGYIAIYTGPVVGPLRPAPYSDSSVAELIAAPSAATRAAVDARVTAVGNATYAPVFADSTTIAYSGGNVSSVTTDGVATTYTYNPDGTVATDTRAGVTRTYTYDGSGNLTGIEAS